MLENRFSSSPAHHPAQRPCCGREDSGAAGWKRMGPRPPAPRAALWAPASSSIAPPPADGRRGQLVPAQATLPSAGAAPGAQNPPRRLRTPAPVNSARRGGPAIYLLLGVF